MEEKKDKAKPEEKKEEAKKKEKDGLNDIILDKLNANKKPKNIKKVLLGISSMILLFLVVLLVMKFINSSNGEESVALIPSKDSVKTSVVEESKEGVESKQEDEDIFKKAPIEAEEQTPSKEIEEEDNFDEMVKSLKEKEIASQKQEIKTSSVEEKVSSKTSEIEKQIKKEVEPQKSAAKTPKVTALAKSKEAVKEKEIVKADKNIKTPKISKPKKEIVKTSVSCPTPVKVNKVKGYFIQVSASFKTLPTKEFLGKIERNGFRYIIKKSMVRGQRATKVLVGPYSTKEKALKDLPKVKEIINPDAFILRMR